MEVTKHYTYLINEILNYPKLFDKRGSITAKLVDKNSNFHKTHLYKKIVDATKFLSETVTLTERVYCVMHNISACVLCTECNHTVNFRNGKFGYSRYCGSACSNGSELKKQTTKNSVYKTYGVPYIKQHHISHYDLINLYCKDWLYDQHYNKNKSISEIANSCGVSKSMVGNRFHQFKIKINKSNSLIEKHIFTYIAETYNTDIICNSFNIIPPKEIDIFLPAYSLAIEVNGVYWHGPLRFENKQKWFQYHTNKEIKCQKKNIRLLHIWDGYGDHHSIIDNAITKNFIDNNLEIVFNEIEWP